jgi:hypothetical protein
MTDYITEHKIIICDNAEVDPQVRAYFTAVLEKSFEETLMGHSEPNKPRMLRYRNGHFESVEIDAIEPASRCPRCGPILLCPEHFTCT